MLKNRNIGHVASISFLIITNDDDANENEIIRQKIRNNYDENIASTTNY